MEENWIHRFKTEVIPILMDECKPEKVLLFGSHVAGKADESSDIDVIVISKSFAHIPFIKRMPRLLKRINFEKHIDIICYSPKEFEKLKASSSLVIDALENGIWLV